MPAQSGPTLEQALTGFGQRAAQAALSPEQASRLPNGTSAGHPKCVPNASDMGSAEKLSQEGAQPSDRSLGTEQAIQSSQQARQSSQLSQRPSTPLGSVMKTPLHHEKPWEDTDEENSASGGQPAEMDWERHITASSTPGQAGAQSAPTENEHPSEGRAVTNLGMLTSTPGHLRTVFTAC